MERASAGRAGVPSTTSGSSFRAKRATATAIAAYVAKYATKTADGTAWLAHPLRSAAQVARLDLRPHIAAMVRTAWSLGLRKDLRHLRLRAHAHTLGYGGQFSSKSLRFSTTFAALRGARAAYVRGDAYDDIRLRRGVALRRSGLRPPRVRRARRRARRGLPPGSRECPQRFLKGVPNAMTRDDVSEKFLDGHPLGTTLVTSLRNPLWRDGAMTNRRSPLHQLRDHLAVVARSPQGGSSFAT